jgi:hypothetical protein
LLLLIASGCRWQKYEVSYSKLFVSWFSTFKVTSLRPFQLDSGALLERPFYTWNGLVRLDFLDHGVASSHCLHYRIPKKDGNDGIFRVTIGKNCEDYQKNILLDIVDIKKFKLFKKKGTQKLSIHFEGKTEQFHWEFPLYNLVLKKDYKKFDSPYLSDLNKGVRYRGLGISEKKPLGESLLFGKKGDSFAKGDAIVCHKVGPDCRQLESSQCQNCRYGWYQMAGNSCPGGGSKYCGVDLCGESGQPACPKGDEFKNFARISCQDGSNAGFCLPTLNTYCRNKVDLVCL